MTEKKNGHYPFISLFVKGAFTCKSMEIGIIEGTINLHLSDQGTFTPVGAQGGFLGTQP